MRVNLRMSSQKVVDLSRLMGGEVVGNHVDLFAARLVDDDVRQEGHELCRSVTHGRFAEYLASLSIECRVQGQRAVPEVFKAMSLGASRREWQHRILAVECRNRRLFIHTEHRRCRKLSPMLSRAVMGGINDMDVRETGALEAFEMGGPANNLGPAGTLETRQAKCYASARSQICLSDPKF